MRYFILFFILGTSSLWRYSHDVEVNIFHAWQTTHRYFAPRNPQNLLANIPEKDIHYFYLKDDNKVGLNGEDYALSKNGKLQQYINSSLQQKTPQILVLRYSSSLAAGATPGHARLLQSLFLSTHRDNCIVVEEMPVLLPPQGPLPETIVLQIYHADKFVKVRRADDLVSLKSTMAELRLDKDKKYQLVLHLSFMMKEQEAIAVVKYLETVPHEELMIFPKY